MELGWQLLPYNKIKIYQAQFLFKFDSKSEEFRVLNDCMKYNIAELSWNFLKEENLYNLGVDDKIFVKLDQDSKTGKVNF
jgi:hypothetical protein